MKLVKSISTLALSVLLFSSSCTSDGTEPVETVEEENRVPAQSDEVVDSELPSPEAASAEAQKAGEAIDSNSSGEVQNLPSEQQIAVDQSANYGGQEVAAAPVAGAEGYAAPAPTDAPTLPEAPPAAAEAAATPVSPAVPAEEVAPAEPIPTIGDVAANAEPAKADKGTKKSKKSKKGKSNRGAKKTPVLSGEKVYVVQPGDTLGSIALTLYGSKSEWKALAELNGLDSSGLIYPGDTIKYTATDATAAYEARYDGLAKVSVTVEKGDTLSKIAVRVMGQAQFWKLLWRWNESTLSDPNIIAVGQTLQYVSTKDLEAASAPAAAEAPAH